MTDTRCRYNGDDQPRTLVGRHLDTCPDHDTTGSAAGGCARCQPCTEGHCQIDRCTEHVTVDGRGTDLTCPSCLAATRAAIRRIRDLTKLMPTAALERGTLNSTAILHAAPAADYEAWSHHHASMTAGRLCRCRHRGQTCPTQLPTIEGPTCGLPAIPPGQFIPTTRRHHYCTHDTCNRRRGLYCPDLLAWITDCRDELHPTYVLGTWDFLVRDHYGHTLDLVGPLDAHGHPIATRTFTLDDTATYLDQRLTALAHDPDFDFNQLHTETTRCAAHLEDVLAVTPHHQKGAICPACERTALERHHGAGDDEDTWDCPRCGWQLTDTEHLGHLRGIHAETAPVMTAAELEEIHGIPAGSVRGWATRGVIARAGKNDQGHRLYDVASVLAHRDRYIDRGA